MKQNLHIRVHSNTDPITLEFTPWTTLAHQEWYLKQLTPNLLVFENELFQIIVPFNQNLLIKESFVPSGIQRIDPVFKSGNNNFEIDILSEISKNIKCGLLSWSTEINNLPKGFTKIKRNNYILNLQPAYQELRLNYNSGLRNSLNRNALKVQDIQDVNLFVDFYLKYSSKAIPKKYKKAQIIKNLMSECIERKAGMIKCVYNLNGEILAMAFFTIFNKRLVYMYSCSAPEGREKDAMHAILDNTIYQYSGQNYFLDFEGSMIPGIASFMQSFGPKIEYYYIYSWNLHWYCKIINLFKKYIQFFKIN